MDGPFSNAVDETTFQAALMDRGGLYEQEGTNWMFFSNMGPDNPSGFYSTRISSHIGWINSVINFEPGIDMQITGFQPVGADMQISFTTGSNKVYRVESRDELTSGSWTTLTNDIVGSGAIMTATDAGAATLPKRFYRLRLVP